jgi:hypothetical protein
MLITQLFETTVVDRESGLEARFVSVPRRAFLEENLLPPLHAVANNEVWDAKFDQLVVRLTDSRVTALTLNTLLAAVLTCFAQDNTKLREQLTKIKSQELDTGIGANYLQFAEMLTFAPLVPFEQSPISLDSVASVISKASGVGLGAYAGFVVVVNSPLIFVTVPAGMIIFGAAHGVADALQKGLRDRVLKLMKGKRSRLARNSRRSSKIVP